MTAAAIFVKTPGYSPLKTRLAAAIGQSAAEEFHRLSALAVASVLKQAAISRNIQPYWAVAEDNALHDPLWQDFPTTSQGEGGLGDRLHHVYQCLQSRHGSAILLGADSPQLHISLIAQALEILADSQPRAVLGPCTDGGFYLCGVNIPLPAQVWTNVPYSCAQTAAQWTAGVEKFAPVTSLEPLADVDVEDDLALVMSALKRQGERTAEQQALLEWYGRYQAGDWVERPDGRKEVPVAE